jgi:general secretion pathway protein D
VNEGSGVQLTIEQEVSSVSGATGVDISINKREIKTVVMADSGATVVLGGLIDEDVQESEQKVPLLGDIPFIGHLFKSTTTSTRKRNLMVFIRPTIIRDGKLMNEISKEKYNYIRATEIRKQEEGLSLMSDEKMPLLPEWNDQLTLPPSFDEYMKESQSKDSSLLPPVVKNEGDDSSTSDQKDQ